MNSSPAPPPIIELRRISVSSAASVAVGRPPADLLVAPDYPTEFSVELARSIHDGEPLGPFFLLRTSDQVVVGEIGGTLVEPSVMEIGYAVVGSARGRGYATLAVRGFIELARAHSGIARLIAHTPLDRPASRRVLSKSNFRCTGEIADEYDGVVMRVQEWEHWL
ncbi:MAG: GNAT family N-acetyltransferase [Nakamurella sp.]